MENMVNVYFFGKKYTVPADLTIMTAMEYAGYTLKRGCGCRHGFCGACATIYRIKGDNELKTCLACQTQVQEGMYVASIPFFPTDKRLYNIYARRGFPLQACHALVFGFNPAGRNGRKSCPERM